MDERLPLPDHVGAQGRLAPAPVLQGTAGPALHPFRGIIYDVDPTFSNSEEWYESIPEAVRPARDQPYYHLLAEIKKAAIQRKPERPGWSSRLLRNEETHFHDKSLMVAP